MKNRLTFGARQIYMASGALAGVFAALSLEDPPALRDLAGGFMHAFPAEFSLGAIGNAVLLQLLPALLIILSGGMLFCETLCSLILSLRCAADGFILCSFFRASPERDVLFAIVWACLLIFETLTVLCLTSMAYLAEKFLAEAKNGRARRAFARYIRNGLFYCGLIFILYLMRGTAVLLFGI